MKLTYFYFFVFYKAILRESQSDLASLLVQHASETDGTSDKQSGQIDASVQSGTQSSDVQVPATTRSVASSSQAQSAVPRYDKKNYGDIMQMKQRHG